MPRQSSNRGPVFDLPASQEGVGESRQALVRIVDPSGIAIAWFATGTAQCLEFDVRTGDEAQLAWKPVLGVLDSQATEVGLAGCAVLASLYDPSTQIEHCDRWSDHPEGDWHLLERDPTSVILKTVLYPQTDDVSANAGNVHGRFSARLDDGSLILALALRNEGSAPRYALLGLRPVFATALFDGFPHLSIHQGDRISTLDLDQGDDGAASTIALDALQSGPAQTDQATQIYLVATNGDPLVAVSCDEGVLGVSQIASNNDDLVMCLLGSLPGQPLLLPPGAGKHLSISIAVLPGGNAMTLAASPTPCSGAQN